MFFSTSRFSIVFFVLLSFTLIPPITATAGPIVVVDLKSGQFMHAENSRLKWHPASLTKMMTAYTLFSAINSGELSPDMPITMTASAAKLPPSRSGLRPGQKIALKDALYVLMVKSANDIALALAENVSGSEAAFAARMNVIARKLGMSDSHFVNPHGLHNEAQISSARDMALLGAALLRDFSSYDKIYRTKRITLDGVALKSHNPLLERVKGATGLKTGYICSGGYNIVASAKRGNRRYLVVMLGGQTSKERGEKVNGLMQYFLAGNPPMMSISAVQSDLQKIDISKAPLDMRPIICPRSKNAVQEYPAHYVSSYAAQIAQPLPKRTHLQKPVALYTIAPKVVLPKRRPNDLKIIMPKDQWLGDNRPKQRYIASLQ